MSETQKRLVALMFDDPYKADEARAALRRMAGEGLLEIGVTALIEKRADASELAKEQLECESNFAHRRHFRRSRAYWSVPCV